MRVDSRKRIARLSTMDCPIPIIDISPFLSNQPSKGNAPSEECIQTAQEIYSAFSEWGFCLIKNHGIPAALRNQIFQAANEFFTLPNEIKLELHVQKGGVAWRGFMPRGGEATHGFTDHKEGMYFGPEDQDSHHHAGLPLVCVSMSWFNRLIDHSTARTSSQMIRSLACVLQFLTISTKSPI
jgi:isopenicillin N synthase-like dioxygenase